MYPTHLSESYYELSKNGVTQWQLLFDCNVRGVKLAKGLPSRGESSVYSSGCREAREGDSGRCDCGVAEAMVRSLELEGAANVEDFGIGTWQGEMCRLRRSGKRALFFEVEEGDSRDEKGNARTPQRRKLNMRYDYEDLHYHSFHVFSTILVYLQTFLEAMCGAAASLWSLFIASLVACL